MGCSPGFVLTGGEASDYQAVDDLVALPVANPKRMLVDKGCDSDNVRSGLPMNGVLPVIPPRVNRKTLGAYQDRSHVERNRPALTH